jgi:hypothetical protein
MSTAESLATGTEPIRLSFNGNSFQTIDQEIRSIGLETLISAASTEDRVKRLATLYPPVRPLLRAIALTPIIPPHWRAALRLLIATLDDIATATRPDFKEGRTYSRSSPA